LLIGFAFTDRSQESGFGEMLEAIKPAYKPLPVGECFFSKRIDLYRNAGQGPALKIKHGDLVLKCVPGLHPDIRLDADQPVRRPQGDFGGSGLNLSVRVSELELRQYFHRSAGRRQSSISVIADPDLSRVRSLLFSTGASVAVSSSESLRKTPSFTLPLENT